MDVISLALGLAKFVGPTVARWLGGEKGEEAAKDVISIAEKITGKKGEDAEKAIAADPQLALKFKIAILDNKENMDSLYLKDRQDARKRDVALHKMGYKNNRADLMIFCVAVALCLDIYLISVNNMKPEVLAIFNMMIGALLKMLSDAFQFEFGSSRGSKEKDILK